MADQDEAIRTDGQPVYERIERVIVERPSAVGARELRFSRISDVA